MTRIAKGNVGRGLDDGIGKWRGRELVKEMEGEMREMNSKDG